jgi:predicted O-methyltransferase YrrM
MRKAMDKLLEYIGGFLSHTNPVLKELEEEYQTREDVVPHIGIHVGVFLNWLIQVMRAKRVLEFGTCIGYSTIFLGLGLQKTGGHLIAIESREEFYQEAERNVERAGLSDVVELIQGDASQIVHDLVGPFDLILQDAAKSLYPVMLEKCIQLIRPGGVIAADDALFRPMGVREELSEHMDAYNEKVFADPRLVSTILPIGDGLTISMKK